MVRIISVIASSITSVQWWHVKPEHENIFAFYILAGWWLMAKFSLEPLNVLAMLELWAVRVRIVITVGRRHYHLRTPDTVICPGTFLQLELFVTFESFARVLLRFAALCAIHLGTEVLFTTLGSVVLWFFRTLALCYFGVICPADTGRSLFSWSLNEHSLSLYSVSFQDITKLLSVVAPLSSDIWVSREQDHHHECNTASNNHLRSTDLFRS